jgi:hypothetical protein
LSAANLAINGKTIEEVEKKITPEAKADGVAPVSLLESEKGFLKAMAQLVFSRENKISVFNEMAVLTDEITAAKTHLLLSQTDLDRLRASIEYNAKKLDDKVGGLFALRALVGQFEKPEEAELNEKTADKGAA